MTKTAAILSGAVAIFALFYSATTPEVLPVEAPVAVDPWMVPECTK